VCEDEQQPAAPNRCIFNVLGKSARRNRGAWRHRRGAEVGSRREIYESIFIGRVVSFIDVAEVGMDY
jgi:hypothetical protein